MTDRRTNVERLRELALAVTKGRDAVACEFTMRVPAEPERDADLVLSTAAIEIEALRAEVERLRADAERYRWLRAEHEPADLPIAQVVWKRGNDPHADWVNLVDGGDLDRHIDAAMEATNAG